jgi:hypothetical protein
MPRFIVKGQDTDSPGKDGDAPGPDIDSTGPDTDSSESPEPVH